MTLVTENATQAHLIKMIYYPLQMQMPEAGQMSQFVWFIDPEFNFSLFSPYAMSSMVSALFQEKHPVRSQDDCQ